MTKIPLEEFLSRDEGWALPSIFGPTRMAFFFSPQRGEGRIGLEKSLQDQMSLRFPELPRFHSARHILKNQPFLFWRLRSRNAEACDVKRLVIPLPSNSCKDIHCLQSSLPSLTTSITFVPQTDTPRARETASGWNKHKHDTDA